MAKVIVAMSGGLDSSVAAALLKRAGFGVTGVFMKFWSEPDKNGLVGVGNRCCSPEAEVRARKVAKILKIPFYVFNFEKEFKKRIVDYFLTAYKKGITPNPCVVCNKEIKFGLLLEKVLTLGADFVATGHYARKSELTTNNLQLTTYKLLMAKDKDKDQSYFLWMLNQNQLKNILFPVGDLTKNQVRKLAKKFRLPVVKTPESMEICFVPADINDFLKKYLKTKPGPIVEQVHYGARKILIRSNLRGREMGEHDGLWFYTIGQRKGIKLPGGPYYVLDKDLKKNLLIVTKNEKDLYKKELVAKNVNWISGKMPKLPLMVKAKIRYSHRSASTKLTQIYTDKSTDLDRFIKVVFEKPQRAITFGQSVVFYKGQELLGGGIIC